MNLDGVLTMDGDSMVSGEVCMVACVVVVVVCMAVCVVVVVCIW